MHVRNIVSIATLTLAGAALLIGCGDKPGATSGAGTTKKPTTAKPKASASTTAAAKPAGEKFGKGVIKATVKFTGEAPEMKVPTKRKEAELCKDTDVVYNAVIVKDGKLKDVFVGIADGQLKGEYEATTAAKVDQKECMYAPRIQGVVEGQGIEISNSDATLHNVNGSKGTETLFNTAQPKGAPPLKKEFEETGVYRLKCDVHSWMRAFVIAADNPFNGVTAADGTVSIAKVPDGKYKVMAWHSQYGAQEKEVEVKGGEVAVEFEYKGLEAEPAENKGELNGLW